MRSGNYFLGAGLVLSLAFGLLLPMQSTAKVAQDPLLSGANGLICCAAGSGYEEYIGSTDDLCDGDCDPTDT